MFDFIVPVGIVAIMCFTIYRLFELFVRRHERTLLIEKLSEIPAEKLTTDPASSFLGVARKHSSSNFWGLRIGMFMLGVGFGLVIAYLVVSTFLVDTVNYVDAHRTLKRIIVDSVEIVYGSFVLLFGGLSLVVSFIFEQKYYRANREIENTLDNE